MTVLMALALILTAAFYFLSSRTTWHASSEIRVPVE